MSPNITDQQINVDPNMTTITISSLNMMTSINLLTKGVADGNNTVDVGVSFHSFNGTGDILLDFLHFNSTFNYDPDFSVTLGSEGDGGSGDLKLLALLSLLLVPAVFILAAVVVGTIICIYNRRRINRSQAINYVSNAGKDDL